MKAMKFMLVAVAAFLMGNTLTSCLDSEDPRPYQERIVNFNEMAGTLYSLTTDDGYTLKPVNASQMQLIKDTEKFYPKRAWIGYYFPGDVIPSEGQKEYDIEFASYVVIFEEKDLETQSYEASTPITAIDRLNVNSSDHCDLLLTSFVTKDSGYDNFKMFIDKAENETIYINLVNVEKMESFYDRQSIAMSFRMPTRNYMNRLFPEFTPYKQDSAFIQITAKGVANPGGYQDIKLDTYKIRLK